MRLKKELTGTAATGQRFQSVEQTLKLGALNSMRTLVLLGDALVAGMDDGYTIVIQNRRR
jgi:hypothetical protein